MLNCLSLIEIGLRTKSEKQVAPREGRGAQHRRAESCGAAVNKIGIPREGRGAQHRCAEGCGVAFRGNYSEIKAAALSTVDTRPAALV